MKQILLFLLISTSIFAQNPTKFEKVRITSNTTSTTATKVNVQESDGQINTISKSDLVGVEEYASASVLPVTGEAGKIYVTLNNNLLYRWNGSIYIEFFPNKELISNKISTITGYSEILYPNEKATKDALDAKLNISDLPSNLTLYATNVPSGISTYTKWVSTLNDPDYNTTAVDISTGIITGTAQLLNGLSSIGGVIVGNPGEINVTTVGEIRRTSGTGTAKFYFELYKRSDAGVEEFLGVSNFTLPVDFETYAEFSATSILNNGIFLATDRLVIKFYGSRIAGGSDPTFQFQFGGLTPVRTIVPVPFRVLASEYELKANKVSTLTASDILYPNNNAVIAGLALKANLDSPTFTGIPTVPTATAGTNTTQVASTAFVTTANANAVLLTGDQTIDGVKSFVNDISVNGLTVGRGGGSVINNLAIGISSLQNNTGSNNTGAGYQSLFLNVGNIQNTALGSQSLYSNAGNFNTGIGYRSLFLNAGSSNTAVGNFSLINNTTGSGTLSIGADSGRFIANKSTSATVINNSTLLGYRTSPLGDNQTNQTVIGYDATGLGSNTTVIGNSSTTTTALYGRVLANKIVDNGIDDGQFNGTISHAAAITANQGVIKSQLDLKANDTDVVKLTGAQTLTDAPKTFNTSVANAPAIKVNNTSSGYGISVSNTSSGSGLYSQNDFNGNAIFASNTSSGNGIVSNTTSTGTGFNFIGRNAGTNTFTVDKFGSTTANSFVKTGGTASQFLKADGSVDGTFYQPTITNNITGTGTTNFLPKFTSAGEIGNSFIQEIGNIIQVNTPADLVDGFKVSAPSGKLRLSGFINAELGSAISAVNSTETEVINLRFNTSAATFSSSVTATKLIVNKTADNGIDVGQFNGTVSGSNATLSNQFVTKSQLDGVKPYKVYTALISQTGTNAPVATVLENTLGGTVTFVYSNIGNYGADLIGAFTANKTAVIISNGAAITVASARGNTDRVSINTVNDSEIINATIEIRVYN